MTSSSPSPSRLQRSWQAATHRLVGVRDRLMFSDRWSHGWPIRDAREEGAPTPFFVVGSPRSGTTLLRAMLTRHPDLFIPPENGALGPMIRTFASHRRSSWETVVDAVLEAFRNGYEFEHWDLDLASVARRARELEPEDRSLRRLLEVVYRAWGDAHAPGKSRWADKTVSGSGAYLDKVALVFPECCYVHLVRDGRDCVASALKAGMFRRDATSAAYGWKDSVLACRRLGRRLGATQYLELRYEDLVRSPAASMTTLCTFLDLSSTPEMIDYAGVDDVSDVNAIAHHENVRRPIFSASVGKWRQQLAEEDASAVTRLCGPELAHFGYE